MSRRIYFSSIDKDVRRVIGKKLYRDCEEKNGGWIVAERSNGDAEYHLTPVAYNKLRDYMYSHSRSRLSRAYCGVRSGDYCLRFEVDSWQ